MSTVTMMTSAGRSGEQLQNASELSSDLVLKCYPLFTKKSPQRLSRDSKVSECTCLSSWVPVCWLISMYVCVSV